MSIQVAVTCMFLVTANIARTCTSLRGFQPLQRALLSPLRFRYIYATSARHHIVTTQKIKHIVGRPMMLSMGTLGVENFSLNDREDEIDEDEEIPLSEEEKRIKELLEESDDNVSEDDGDDTDDSSDPKGKSFNEGSLRLKVRQHVNPLASRYLIPMEGGDEWVASAFADTSKPVVVDIGCAKGTWVLKYAAENPERNIVGLEIRKPVVEFALQRKAKWGLQNVHFLSVNANIDLDRILSDLKRVGGSIEMVTIQFPDPHFKKKHKKRRVVNELLVDTIVSQIEIGKTIFLQSDILDVTEDMIANFSKNEQLEIAEGYDVSNLTGNISPNNVLTEREIATQKKELPIYRIMYRKIK